MNGDQLRNVCNFFIDHILFIIVVLILLHLSYCVNICHVFVCILSVYLSGTTMELSACLHFFVSSFYLMYFVFISYVYHLYNVLHVLLSLSRGETIHFLCVMMNVDDCEKNPQMWNECYTEHGEKKMCTSPQFQVSNRLEGVAGMCEL